MTEIVPDHVHRGAFLVRAGVTEQSWVDPSDPLRLEFEYVQRIAEALEATILERDDDLRPRLLHIGGGGLTIPRYVAARRPDSVQIVLEPDAHLVELVRSRLPLPRQGVIKIRITDGRSGIAEIRPSSFDVVVVDAFVGSQVPAELATVEFFESAASVLRTGGVLVMNLGDRAPFSWARRCLAGLLTALPRLSVSAETAVWKGRRFGNLVALAGTSPLPLARLERGLARAAFPYRQVADGQLRSWIASAEPFTDADSQPSVDAVANGWLR